MKKVIIASVLLAACLSVYSFAVTPTPVTKFAMPKSVRSVTSSPFSDTVITKYKTDSRMNAEVMHGENHRGTLDRIFVSTRIPELRDNEQPGGIARVTITGNRLHFTGRAGTGKTGRLTARVIYNKVGCPLDESSRTTTSVEDYPHLYYVSLSIVGGASDAPARVVWLTRGPSDTTDPPQKSDFITDDEENRQLSATSSGIPPEGDYSAVVNVITRSGRGEFASIGGLKIQAIILEEEAAPTE